MTPINSGGDFKVALPGPIPVSSIHTDQFEKFLSHQKVEYLCRGQTLFQMGEEDNATVYLLSGELELSDIHGKTQIISAGTRDSWHPIAHQQPRSVTAKALTDCSYISFDRYRYDTLLAWDQAAGYMVLDISTNRELDDDANWMIKLLHSDLFYRVPPANIMTIFKRFEPVAVSAGEIVFHQGDQGDSCYYIKSGEFAVLFKVDEKQTQVATLCEGGSFGEDALLSGAPRNATITAMTDGLLMRLEKQHFDALLKNPVLAEVSYEEAQARVAQGAQWIDVRLDAEYHLDHITGSIHMPLHLLRLKSRLLDKHTPYIVYCDTGQRSAAATFLLSQAGFDVYLLSGAYAIKSLS